MASSAALIKRIFTGTSNPNTFTTTRSSIRSFSSTLYWIVKPSPRRARDDAPDDLHRSGLLIEDKDDALYLQKSMPGLGKENVDVEIDPKRHALIIKGEPGGYETLLHLPPSCRSDEGLGKMENGLLRVIVPKNKPNQGSPMQQGPSPWEAEEYKSGDAVLIVGYHRQDE
ncbi:hypothetical protein M0R45_003968 [Rubus argutus]|uniref:SHSP domain-containing protein n=1 Tax=Rubus argutus TaxID=59490 RepID=A0AAW1YIQ7_RUBAR